MTTEKELQDEVLRLRPLWVSARKRFQGLDFEYGQALTKLQQFQRKNAKVTIVKITKSAPKKTTMPLDKNLLLENMKAAGVDSKLIEKLMKGV